MRLRVGLVSVVVLSVLASRAVAQTPPLASEFQVNTTTTSDQYGYGVAMDNAGNFVVSWESYGQDGDSYSVQGRRFDNLAAPRGGEFQVNQVTAYDQGYPAVASDPAGNFVVVWQSDSQDGSGSGVFARRYDKTGASLGAEFRVNTFTTGDQLAPQVATDAGGNFVVVWQSAAQDGAATGVFGQRFNNAGTPVAAEFPVNSYTTGDQLVPTVAMDAAGDFVVVWRGAGPTSADGVFARRYNSAGVAQGIESQVNTSPTPSYPVVAMDKAGAFAVVWEGYPVGGSGRDAVARRFDSSGVALGPEFRVNTYTTGNQFSPAIGMDPSGNFTVAWESPQDGAGSGIFGQRFDRSGNFIGSEFQINAFTTGNQQLPRVAASGSGDFVAMWSSYAQDGDSWGVYGRRSALAAASTFQVDARAASTGTSNVNGILEPGETVVVEPGWSNSGSTPLSVTGSAPSFTGPVGATYGIDDATADYGSVSAGGSNNCFDATGDCYEVTVSNPATRPATHWDATLQETLSAATPKTWTLHVGQSFTDVPLSQPFYKKIETLLHSGITAGCTITTYCPGDTVSRSQMSLFVGRGIAGSGAAIPPSGKVNGNAYQCGAGGTSLFTDVPPTDIACRSVHYIAAQNVTLGCSPTTYCPTQTVTRDAMASFMAKAIVAPAGGNGVPVTYGPDPVTGLSYSCNVGSPNIHFTDVPATNSFCKHIHYLWARGIIGGCGGTLYCPGDPVTRDAMAKFLTNAFATPLYGP
jgi:hypothetical protein